jgi:hypothetical protein
VTSGTGTKSKRKPAWHATSALERGLADGGCPVCRSLQRAVRRYIFSFLYEGIMSGSARETFLKGGGFCREHFWQAKNIEAECWADGFGVAILCENLLVRCQEEVEQIPESKPERKSTLLGFPTRPRRQPAMSGLTPGSGCTVCAVQKESENHYLAVLEELLEDADFSRRYQHSAGLCFSHLRAAAGQWQSSIALQVIKSTANRAVRELVGDLREFQRKHDYQYRHEPRELESTSPQRAIQFLVGLKADMDGAPEAPTTQRKRR